jgi:alpha-D-xyloside xylohydrolase
LKIYQEGQLMFQPGCFLTSILNTDLSQDILLSAEALENASLEGEEVVFTAALYRKEPYPGLMYFHQESLEETREGELHFRLRFYGGEVIRLLISRTPRQFEDDTPMLAWDPSLSPRPCSLDRHGEGWLAGDGQGAELHLRTGYFAPSLSPDGRARLDFQGEDQFFPHLRDALPACVLLRPEQPPLLGIAFKVQAGEHFCGTGERFERPDLSGQQIDLVNIDAAGVNTDRAYKNIPFLLSSRGYGLFAHSSAKMRLDIAAHSARSLQWVVEDDQLDLFIIGGGSPASVIRNYQRITGFAPLPPAWSFGVWMSRSTYFTAAEATGVAQRLREEGYPADVIHLDTGWFAKDWVCDWKFSEENFPDPPGFLDHLRSMGFRVSLWQNPFIHPESALVQEALERGYVGQESAHSRRFWLGYTLDFTNPEAVAWFKSLIEPLLRMGAAALKADFGEEVDEGARYLGLEGWKYHNLFSLLYQKIIWESTERVHGAGEALIWARSGWAGSQRYPVHWGGDAPATFDGLAGSLRGGLHLGLSGFPFWSHDVGGIFGIPDFMHTPPTADLYLRWTQVGVFSSHIRYHGGTPREPWALPAASEIVRQWLRLRYMLLPYILSEAGKCCRTGLPMLRSMVIGWPEDPTVWSIADQYLFGDDFLVCPVLSPDPVRPVYLPEGEWVDFWSGEKMVGPLRLEAVRSPLSRLPLYVRAGSAVEFAEPVEHTGQLPAARRFSVRFDGEYPGFNGSEVARYIEL